MTSYRPLLFLAPLLALAQPLASAGGLGRLAEAVTGNRQPSTVTVLLLDRSASVKEDDARIYRQACDAFLATIRAGDRVVIGVIGEQSVGRFVAVADRASVRRGVALDDREAASRLREAIRADLTAVLAPDRTEKRSMILDAVSAGADLLAGASQERKRLVMLTDGVEESNVANFANGLDAPAAKMLIERRRRAGVLPPLTGVEVWVIGIGGRTIEQHLALRLFWSEYLAASGAKVVYTGRSAPEVK